MPRGAICAGMYSSGSTWVFNIVLSLLRLRTPGQAILPAYADRFDEAAASAIAGSAEFVLKTHRPDAALRDFVERAQSPIFMTIRDPRDAVASLMLRFDKSFADALSDVASSAAILPLLRAHPRLHLLRYEDGFAAKRRTLEILAAVLGVSPSQDEIESIAQRHAPDAVRRRLQLWQEHGVFAPGPAGSVFDPETHWHPNHVGDGRSGKWQEVLSSEQAAMISDATRDYCTCFAYSCAGPANGGAPA